MKSYSVVIPVFRGQGTLEQLIRQCHAFFTRQAYVFEVILVWDGGSPESWNAILELKAEYGDLIKGVRLSRNFGQHNALIAGFGHAQYEYIITMDEDLQHDPEDIQLLIEKQIHSDSDLVYGFYHQPRHNIFRNTTSYLLRLMIAYGIPDLHRDYSPFRLIRTELAKKTLEMNNSYTFVDGYLSWITSDVVSVQVGHHESKAGKSSYTLKKLFEHSINIFVTFSNAPIRLLIVLSLSMFFLSFSYGAYVLIRKLVFDDFITGFATMAVFSGMGFGVLLFGMGVLGEYIQRINLKTTRRPNYIEKEVI